MRLLSLMTRYSHMTDIRVDAQHESIAEHNVLLLIITSVIPVTRQATPSLFWCKQLPTRGTISLVYLHVLRAARSCNITTPFHSTCRLPACCLAIPEHFEIRVKSVSSKGYISTDFQTTENHRKRSPNDRHFVSGRIFLRLSVLATLRSAHFKLTDFLEPFLQLQQLKSCLENVVQERGRIQEYNNRAKRYAVTRRKEVVGALIDNNDPTLNHDENCNNSPSFSAKYLVYSLIDLATGLTDFELVQKGMRDNGTISGNVIPISAELTERQRHNYRQRNTYKSRVNRETTAQLAAM
ncbi:hypothetical protein PR048_003942 [Dryococelus australis]|uniref:Uncharacterized protein n=1 Tax=Dryococelus australis TaxID=614101 RepID=A0ABQ9I590_9NEOP|nr:hypothetical protein PR048_003942 [Dryococelus australis]